MPHETIENQNRNGFSDLSILLYHKIALPVMTPFITKYTNPPENSKLTQA